MKITKSEYERERDRLKRFAHHAKRMERQLKERHLEFMQYNGHYHDAIDHYQKMFNMCILQLGSWRMLYRNQEKIKKE